MAISASDVKALRDATGAGMMDCKKALNETKGDFDEAVAWLREKGMAAAAKRADRAASEGAVAAQISDDGNMGVMVEINCETDFVARGEIFVGLVENICRQLFQDKPSDVPALLAKPYIEEPSKTVEETVKELSGKTGEKIDIRRFVIYELQGEGLLSIYVHMGGKVGVLLEVGCSVSSEAVLTVCKDLCLQICSAAPKWVRKEDVSEAAREAELAIYRRQAAETGKPENICQKIAEGKLNKWYQEVCLLEQAFVKDPDKSIAERIKEAGVELDVRRFARFERGEGIEKQESNLAEEVAQAMADRK